jgi:TP901 family phage tail tape measure protein
VNANTISVLLTANASPLRTQLAAASADVNRFGRQVQGANSGMTSTAKVAAAAGLALGVAFVSAFASSVKGAIEFERRMRNVNSISGLTDAQLGKLSKTVLDMARNSTQSVNTLAEGLYDVASSGFQGAEGIKVLDAANRAASAGMSTTAVAARAITAVLNAYGRGAEDAADVSDVLFQGVNLGVMSFEELASNIGDVVGTAAAAGVGIDQVTAAMATMTLSGISAAESSTSLNRTLQSIIQPSAALKAALASVGYESGAQALEVDGLAVVMEKLRVASGGNIEVLLELFPEIRAARGALALMADDGQTAARVFGEITDEQRRQGATLKAYNEQMKAVGAQWELFFNRINVARVELGTRFLPVLITVLRATEQLVSRGAKPLGDAIQALQPFFQGLWAVIGDVVTILGTLWGVIQPAAAALASIAGGAIIGSLNTLATVLSAITGFLADNQEVVMGLAAVYAATLIPSILQAAAAWGAWGLVTIIQGLQKAATAATGFGKALWTAVAAHPVLAAVAATVGALTFGITKANNQIGETAQLVSELAKVSDGSAAALRKMYEEATTASRWNRILWGEGKAVQDTFAASLRELLDTSPQVAQALIDMAMAEGLVSKNAEGAYVVLRDGVESLLLTDAEMVKLGASTAQASEEIAKLEEAAGKLPGSLANATPQDIEALQAQLEALDAVAKAAGDAFDAATDLASGFELISQSELAENVAVAAERLEDAEYALEQARESAGKKVNADEEWQIAEAREAVTAATEDLKAAEDAQISSAKQLRTFYREQVKEAKDFADNIEDAARRGLDPEVLARLIEAGPEAAAGPLEAMLSDHTGRTIGMVNEAEEKLAEINEIVVANARLTQKAIEAPTDSMVAHLNEAMAISEVNMREGGKASAEAIAEELSLGVETVKQIAAEYGIVLAAGVNPVLKSLGKGVYGVRGGPGVSGWITQAEGGVVPGWSPHPKADNIPALLTAREFVQPVDAVDYYGLSFMEAVRTKKLPKKLLGDTAGDSDQLPVRYATGGFVKASDVPPPPGVDPYTFMVGDPARYQMDHDYRGTQAWVNAWAIPPVAPGVGWPTMMKALRSQFPGLAMISGPRPGAITATGGTSYHGRPNTPGGFGSDLANGDIGRAVDIPPMMSVFDWIRAGYPNSTELIFTPAGGRQLWHGAQHIYTGVTAAMHHDHIHWAMNRGGLVGQDGTPMRPWIRDRGGPLLPGWTFNGTGAPELVIPQRLAPGGPVTAPGRTFPFIPGLPQTGASSPNVGQIQQIFAQAPDYEAALRQVEQLMEYWEELARLEEERNRRAELRQAIAEAENALTKKQRDEIEALADAERALEKAKTPSQRREARRDVRDAQEAIDDNAEVRAVQEARDALDEYNQEVRDARQQRRIDRVMEREAAREQRRQERAAARERRQENKEQWQYDHMTTEQQLAEINTRLEAERKYTDEWVELKREQERLLEDIASAAADAVAAQLEAIDEATEAANDAAAEAQTAADDALEKLNSMIDEYESIRAERAQATAEYNRAVMEEEKEYAAAQVELQSRVQEKLLQLARGFADQEKDIYDRRFDALAGFFDADQRIRVQWGNTLAAITDNARDQLAQFEEWSDALDRVRDMGVSEEVIQALGLDQGPQALGQLRMFANATEQEVADLNAAIRDQQVATNERVTEEQTNLVGTLGEELVKLHEQYTEEVNAVQAEYVLTLEEMRAEHDRRMVEMAEAFEARMAELQAQLDNIGKEQGRTWAEAIAAGVAAGIPAIQEQIEKVKALLEELEAANQAAADAAAAGAAAAKGTTIGAPVAPLPANPNRPANTRPAPYRPPPGTNTGINRTGWTRMAEGGTITASGWALVGEQGPERLYLPREARVEPLSYQPAVTVHVTTPPELVLPIAVEVDGERVYESVIRRTAADNRRIEIRAGGSSWRR